ncbi:MAG: purine-nucleoside phosphorylase [Oscillospiraceae bacterium]
MSMHIDAKPGEIAERILLPGDPMRAKYIAEKYFEKAVCVNEVRGALCYTGTYKGERMSVFGTGMGIPSVLIYTTELCKEYGCEKLVRIGTAGGCDPRLSIMDIVLSQATSTTSSLNDYIFQSAHFAPIADFALLRKAYDISAARGISAFVGNTICNDHLYRDPRYYHGDTWTEYGILASEMEGAALYTVAAHYRKQALMILSVVSDAKDPAASEMVSNERKEKGLDDMISIALDTLCD